MLSRLVDAPQFLHRNNVLEVNAALEHVHRLLVLFEKVFDDFTC